MRKREVSPHKNILAAAPTEYLRCISIFSTRMCDKDWSRIRSIAILFSTNESERVLIRFEYVSGVRAGYHRRIRFVIYGSIGTGTQQERVAPVDIDELEQQDRPVSAVFFPPPVFAPCTASLTCCKRGLAVGGVLAGGRNSPVCCVLVPPAVWCPPAGPPRCCVPPCGGRVPRVLPPPAVGSCPVCWCPPAVLWPRPRPLL